MDIQRKLQIPLVRDKKLEEILLAETINNVFEQHELQEIRESSSKNRFSCFKCGQTVKLYSVADDKYEKGHRYHFQHPPGIQCEWKYDNKTKAEIYAGIKEGKLHQHMKQLLKTTLEALPKWEVVSVDKHFIFSDDRLNRAKPDLHARYDGENIVFEIQLRSEKPETIIRRKNFYRDKGWKLIWISAENSKIVSETHAHNSIPIKQVQKDIAFSNRWNWFIFNEELQEISLREEELYLQTVMWTPTKWNKNIHYQWDDEFTPFSALSYEEGEIFLKDLPLYDAQLRASLRQEGKRATQQLLKKKSYKTWDEFLNHSKLKWPTLEAGGNDGEWLYQEYKQNRLSRELALKKRIIEFFQSREWRDHNNSERWEQIAKRVQGYEFGITEKCALTVIDKLLLIYGYTLSHELSPSKRSFVRACHFFYDQQYNNSFSRYKHLCEYLIKISPYSKQILCDKTMQKRLANPTQAIDATNDLDEFVRWFFSGQLPELSWVKPLKQTQEGFNFGK